MYAKVARFWDRLAFGGLLVAAAFHIVGTELASIQYDDDVASKQLAPKQSSSFLPFKSVLSDVVQEWMTIHSGAITTRGKRTPDQPVIDVISIGSTTRLAYHNAQRTTWASHPAIRHFFNVTEQLDEYKNCTEDVAIRPDGSMDWKDYKWVQLIRQCYKLVKTTPRLLPYRYFRIHWVNEKRNPAGWYCAQPRFGNSIRLVGEFYRRQLQQQDKATVLPDYLVLLDDDSYIQMDLLLEHFHHIDPSVPKVWAGCLGVFIKYGRPRHSPYGGLATLFSRGSLEKLMLTPLNCPSASTNGMDEFVRHACYRILDVNLMFEAESFQNGMTLSDVIGNVANRIPSCLFSDWLTGYFSHKYQLSAVPYNLSANLSSYIHPLRDSFAVSTEHGLAGFEGRGLGCAGNFGCNESTIVCHYLSPDQMRNVSARGTQTLR